MEVRLEKWNVLHYCCCKKVKKQAGYGKVWILKSKKSGVSKGITRTKSRKKTGWGEMQAKRIC